MSRGPSNLGFLTTGATHLDRIPHELSVNSLVSMKSNCERGRGLSICVTIREENRGDYLVVGNLFTFPPRTVTTHGWEICLGKRVGGISMRGEPVALLVFQG